MASLVPPSHVHALPPPEPFFMAARGGAALGLRFCILHRPQSPVRSSNRVRGSVVYVHPFAEEMNKSRRMAALQARALAQDGHAVLQIDLAGCGDSSGDFGDATWDDWVRDIAAAADFMQDRYPDAPLWLWGLRAGCLVATQAAALRSAPCHFLFWQAPASGKVLLQQFLRLKLAADLRDAKAKGATESLRERLALGAPVTIAGYTLSADLAQGLERAELKPPPGAARLEWIDVSSRADGVAAPAVERALTRWRDAGCSVHHQTVMGTSFWQTAEIETVPALVTIGCQALAGAATEGVAA